MLICPVCETALARHEKYYACLNKHSFDISRQGYVNLLLSNQKKSLNPGDNKEMVKSRLRFLSKNHYQPVAEMLNNLVEKQLALSDRSNVQIADLGCGVGYYLSHLKAQLSQTIAKEMGYWGIDISKEAIHCASTQKTDINWLVASTKKLPFESQSLDILLCIFSPSYLEEMMRVLTLNGYVFIITPGDEHLKEIRDLLYDEVKSKENEKILEKTQGFLELETCLPLSYTLILESSEDIENLIKMTPFYWRIPAAKQAQFAELTSLCVTIDIKLWSFKRAQ